jgi:hypothetical protein
MVTISGQVATMGSGAPTAGRLAVGPGRSQATRNPNAPAPAASQPLAVTKPICGAASPVASTANWYTAGCG